MVETTTSSVFDKEEDHLSNQAEAFDMMAPMFCKSDMLPPDTGAVVQHIAETFLSEVVERAQDKRNIRILDIGCGAGVLWRFFVNAAKEMGDDDDDSSIIETFHITGVDVSPQMIEFGKEHAANVLKDADMGDKYSIDCVADDFCRYVREAKQEGTYDGVIANSCFANFFDIPQSVESMTASLTEGGIFCVAHPVGSEFVQGLHDFNPKVTPHLMPTEEQYDTMTSKHPLTRINFHESLEWSPEGGKSRQLPLYYASSVKSS